MNLWDLAAWFGIAVMAMVCLASVVIGLVVAAAQVQRLWPRFHFGAPKADVDLMSYSKQPKPQLFQKLRLSSWFGISSRTKASWFFGLMRWKNVSDGL